MICPFREKTTYEYTGAVLDGRPVVKQVIQEFPECYGDDCPLYDQWGTGNCRRVDQALNEED